MPPKLPPRPKPKPDDPEPEDPEEPEPTESPFSSSSSSCTATSTISPHCALTCLIHPVTTFSKSTSWTTTCHETATCQPTIVQCSQTIEITTTTTYSTASAAPTTFLCGAEDSHCGSCEEKSKVKPRQIEEGDEAVLDGPGLTSPLEWAAGFQDWFNRMYRIMEDYCKGLKEPRTLPSGKRIQMGYSTMNADEFGDKPLMGGTGPLWGCSALVIVTDHGIYTSHNWEVPNFQVPGGVNDPDSPYFGMDLAAEYEHSVRNFLHDGDWDRDYVGLTYLRANTRIFNSRVKKAFIFTPRAGAFYLAVPFPPEHGLGTERSPNTLHDAKVREWDGILREAFPDAAAHDPDFVQVRAYVKGPSYWQPWPGPPNSPMTNYEPPYGLVHWQYHPSHVRVENGVEIRQAGIRLWYEQFLMWEHFWDLPAAPGSPEATATEGSESASASEGAGQPTNPAGSIIIPPANQTSKVTSALNGTSATSSLSSTTVFVLPPTSSKKPVATFVVTATTSDTVTEIEDTTSTLVIGGASGSSSTSSKGVATVVVTTTASQTVTSWDDTTSTVVIGGPSDSSTASRTVVEEDNTTPASSQTTTTRPTFVINNPPKSDRAVLISQEIRFNESTHMAVASVYEYNDEGNVSSIIVEGRASDAGGHVKLPSELLLKDNWGGQLRFNFTQAFFDIEFESRMGSRVQSWGLYTEKNPDDEGAGWCKVDKTAVSLETITRKIECRYTA
ncbi:hypothetical protein CSOJ01_08938 [Colletotrichum sojae]|uniref:Uncharacterized protein n=1 Tax=Colletotrichum sojae TaxID=2175907 RepID=A0A8H6J4A9_9PEZI|nr:hypothetical protein CSOJ01_08938 [Colletotrichum sojae]